MTEQEMMELVVAFRENNPTATEWEVFTYILGLIGKNK